MRCSCPVDPIAFSVPDELGAVAQHLDTDADTDPSKRDPAQSTTAAICPTCLAVERVSESPSSDPDFTRISDAFPAGTGGVALALTLGLLDSLALNRREIERTLEATERAGVDPLLVIDRLIGDPTVEPAIDLERRRDKLESLLY